MNKFLIDFRQKIRQRRLKIAVVGLGYVGLPLACEFAKKGFSVWGIDIDKDRIKQLKNCRSYITDVPNSTLEDLIKRGSLFAANNFKILKDVDLILICVPTPLKRKYEPDISYIINAVKSVAKNIRESDTPKLIILESTTYPGTTEEVILPLFERKGLIHNRDFYLCFSPERVDPGNKRYPLNRIPKIVGGITKEATRLSYVVYKTIIKKIYCVSSSRSAETVKLLENTFRLVNIGLIDEIAQMTHKMKIDIWEVIDAAKTKPFGFMPFYPSPGVGGHCIPKDPLYLFWKAKHFGFRSRFIKLASEITSAMPDYIVTRLADLLKENNKTLEKSQILIIGVTYKKDVKDLRKSPALDIIELLKERGMNVSYFDPLIPYLRLNQINLKSIKLTKKNLKAFDCVLISTPHRHIDYGFIRKQANFIFDICNVYRKSKDRKIIKL